MRFRFIPFALPLMRRYRLAQRALRRCAGPPRSNGLSLWPGWCLLWCWALFASGCTSFDAPPQAVVVGAVEGVLAEQPSPLHIQFNEPVDASTLNVKVIRFETDAEGRLFDEDNDDSSQLDVLFEHTAAGVDTGGIGRLDAARVNFTIDLAVTLPVAAPLALIVEPGLQDDKGNAWAVRQLLVFTVAFNCGNDAPTAFPSAVHYMLAQVEEPIGAQLALMVDMRVDAASGRISAVFSDADRDPAIDCSKFGLSCKAEETCRSLPTPACVAPATQAATVEEYPDYVASPVPPTGFHFVVRACVQDQPDGSFSFGNAPVDVHVTTPTVTVVGIVFNASFQLDDAGVLRGGGSFTSTDTVLGKGAPGASKSPASGTVSSRVIPANEVKPGLPEPPPLDAASAH